MSQYKKELRPSIPIWGYTMWEGGKIIEVTTANSIPANFHSIFFVNGYVFDRKWFELMCTGEMDFCIAHFEHLERDIDEQTNRNNASTSAKHDAPRTDEGDVLPTQD